MINKLAQIIIVWLAIGIFAYPAFGYEEPKTGTLSVVFENDIFDRYDRDYTGGIEVLWVPTVKQTPNWALSVAHSLPWIPEDAHLHPGYSIGQKVFTPRHLTLANPPPNERPYAGWLYGTIGLAAATERALDEVSMTLGVVGPASQAKEVQDFAHEITDGDKPQGWGTQLKNEPGIVLALQHSWREIANANLAGLDLDLTPHVGGAAGNIFTYANAGLMLRYGKNLPLDYGPPRIPPGVQGSGFFTPTNNFGWYLFAGFDGRAVARNIFLDGNTFRESRRVDKEPFVGDLQGGIVFAWRSARLGYTHVVRTREYKTAEGPHKFGALSFSFSF